MNSSTADKDPMVQNSGTQWDTAFHVLVLMKNLPQEQVPSKSCGFCTMGRNQARGKVQHLQKN